MAKLEKLPALIMIDDKYGISVDSIDYSLRKVSISAKTGKPRQDTISYHGSVQGCLKNYMNEIIHDSLESDKDITLREAIARIEAAMDKVYTIITGAFPEYDIVEK